MKDEAPEMKEDAPNVVFTNEPKLSPHTTHPTQSKFNELRAKLPPYIKEYISNSELFKGKDVSITFSQVGVSSLVSILETGGEKFVLKVPLSQGNCFNEEMFLKVWESSGVKVPHIISEGEIMGHSCFLMEYIDAPILGDMYSREERIRNGITFEMGQVLRKMHTPEADGYGHVIDGKAEFSAFGEWLDSEDIMTKVNYAFEQGVVTEDHGSVPKAIEILKSYVGDSRKSSYCHLDYGSSNIFSTHPITIFDPWPAFNNRYIDIGRTVTLMSTAEDLSTELINEFLNGYFEDEVCDRKVLQAAVLLSSCLKFAQWHRTKKTDAIARAQDYLTKNKHYLD